MTDRDRVEQAIDALTQLGLPRQQLNERSALVLLALLDLTPEKSWRQASAPLRGITPMMMFMADHYDKRYAPNSRETVRRQSVHQFVAAGLVLRNPDDPDRPVNSGKTTYQISGIALELLRRYGGRGWASELRRYQFEIGSLRKRWASERAARRIPLRLPDGTQVTLSAGGQNLLTARLVEDFCPVFTPGGRLLYIGDADEKFAIFAEDELRTLGVSVDAHGKMPDLIVNHVDRGWLVLVEAVTSHGPVDRSDMRNCDLCSQGLRPVSCSSPRSWIDDCLPSTSARSLGRRRSGSQTRRPTWFTSTANGSWDRTSSSGPGDSAMKSSVSLSKSVMAIPA